jgi:hypothetical protein
MKPKYTVFRKPDGTHAATLDETFEKFYYPECTAIYTGVAGNQTRKFMRELDNQKQAPVIKKRHGSLEKSARLVVLMQLQDAGRLDGLSLQKIADLFTPSPNRSTILRDLRDVPRVRETIKTIVK